MSDALRIRLAIERGQRDARLLDGRDYDERYWRTAKAALSRLQRRIRLAESDRDALRACIDQPANDIERLESEPGSC